MALRELTVASLLLAATAALLTGCASKEAIDEATAAGKTVADFPETRVDLFQPMDRGIALTPDEIAGRNTWMLWTAETRRSGIISHAMATAWSNSSRRSIRAGGRNGSRR